MGVPRGVTLIVGGGYHGKSTLLAALEHGVYDHAPGDGRELVVTDETATKIRAEDGRPIASVDISAFIGKIPGGGEARRFTTTNASGSTSQAANIVEALEMGTRVLLVDEDTSATNFMIRDHRMQELITKDKEPITPFVDRVRELWEGFGVSTVLVMGGSGDYFDAADRVIWMDAYHPNDATEKAKEIAARTQTGRVTEAAGPMKKIPARSPDPRTVDATRGKKIRIRSRGVSAIEFGRRDINLARVGGLAEPGQTRAAADMLHYMKLHMTDDAPLAEVIAQATEDVAERGLDVLAETPSPEWSLPRKFEVAAALNRLPGVRMKLMKQQ